MRLSRKAGLLQKVEVVVRPDEKYEVVLGNSTDNMEEVYGEYAAGETVTVPETWYFDGYIEGHFDHAEPYLTNQGYAFPDGNPTDTTFTMPAFKVWVEYDIYW